MESDYIWRRTTSKSVEQTVGKAEAAAVDRYFSPPTEIIPIPVCLRHGHQDTENRLIVLGLCDAPSIFLSIDAIQVTQLLLLSLLVKLRLCNLL